MRFFSNQSFRSDRGNALVLSLLIVLTLTSVGLISVQRTNTDLLVAGNVARSTQAFLGSDAGMQHSLALVGLDTQKYLFEKSRLHVLGGTAANNNLTYPIVDSTTAATAAPPVDIQFPLKENLWMSTMDSTNDRARMLQDVAFRITSTWVSEDKGMPGYSMDMDICHEVYDFNAQSGIPTRIESVDHTLQQTDTVVVMSRARAMTGPCKCTK